MKKTSLLAMCLFVLFPLLFSAKANATSYDLYQLDQFQLNQHGSTSVYSDANVNQTFKVTKNILTKIEVLMVHRHKGYGITLTVKDENTGAVVVKKSQRMGDGDGWESFDLLGTGLGYEMNPVHRYSMAIGTAYFTESTPCWVFETGSEAYPRGNLRYGTTITETDAVFKTYGYDLSDAPTPVDPVPAKEETTPVKEDKVVTPDTPVSVADIDEKDIDSAIKSPTLEFVIVDQVIVDSQKEGGVDVGLENTVKIAGTAESGDTVLVTIGEKSFSVVADKEGNWYVLVSTTEFVKGTYTVTAQSQNKEGKGSEKVKLFVLNVLDGSEAITLPLVQEQKTSSPILSYIIYGAGGLLLVGLVLLLIIIRRKQRKEKGENLLKEEEVRI